MAEPDDLLNKADALMARHRPARTGDASYLGIPVLDEVVIPPAESDDPPVLTELIEPEPAQAELVAPEAVQAELVVPEAVQAGSVAPEADQVGSVAPEADQVGSVAPEADQVDAVELPPDKAKSITPKSPAEDEFDALAAKMRASLLEALQPEIDSLIEERLKQSLAPLVEKLFDDMRGNLQLIASEILNQAIHTAVEHELRRRNSGN